MTSSPPDRPERRAQVPRVVWALGFVSLCMDVSSEIVHGLLPVFLTTTLGASVVFVGLVDGIAESTASIVKVFSGYFSDRIGRRKPLILLGYGLAALSKPLFPVAQSVSLILGARFADRIGKGLRGAPRDALVADVTPAPLLGRAFGLRQALDTVGAFLGPLVAVGLMVVLAGDIRAVLWFAVIPAMIAVLLVAFAVQDPVPPPRGRETGPALRVDQLARLDRGFWDVLVVGVVFTLARFSEAFLILKAVDTGLEPALAPLVLVVMALVFALGAYPAGALSDRTGSRGLLGFGLLLLVAADALLALSSDIVPVFCAIALWGAHMAVTQGLFAKLVAENAPAVLRASAFGIFGLATGGAALVASLVAGLLWASLGPAATFLAGAAWAVTAAVLVRVRLQPGHRPD